MNFHLLYDPKQEEKLEKKLLPLIESLLVGRSAFQEDEWPELAEGAGLLTYLSDSQIKHLMPKVAEHDVVLAVLPHPEAKQVCSGLGVSSDLDDAIEFLKSEATPFDLNLLYCNGRPVFNSIIFGDTFQLVSSKFARSVGFFKRVGNFVRRLLQLQPFRVNVEAHNDKLIKTAVSGIVAVQHKQSSLLARFIPGESHVNEGIMHVFLISPRSLFELMTFAIRSWGKNDKLPAFGAHIKTDAITFTHPEENGKLNYTEDGDARSANKVVLAIREKDIKIMPGAALKLPDEPVRAPHAFKVQALPTGEAAQILAQGRLPILRKASTEEFKELFQVLRENAQLKGTYMVLMVLSTVLATFGLFANSTPVVIGAMILAPLMSPIISLSMAALRQERTLAMQSSYTIIAGLGLSLLFAVVITLLTPINLPNSEILSRTRPNLLDLGIAVVSGIAGAYAHAREEVAKTLAGVAIAVALVPPLAVAGIGIGWADWSIFSGAALLLFTNLAGMVLMGSFTFFLLGFSPLRLATKGLAASLLVVALLSIPLALGFQRMMYEHRLVQQLDGWESGKGVIKEVKIQHLSPLSISIKLISAEVLDDGEIDKVKQQIEDKLGQGVRLEITTALDR